MAPPTWVIIVIAVVGASLLLLAILIVTCVLKRRNVAEQDDFADDAYPPTRKVVVRRGRIVPASWNISLTAASLFGDRSRTHHDFEHNGGHRSRSPFGLWLSSTYSRAPSSHSQTSQLKTTRQGNMQLLNDVDENFLKLTPSTKTADSKRPAMSERSFSFPSILNGRDLADDGTDKRSRPPTSGTSTGVIEEADEGVPETSEVKVPVSAYAGSRPKNPEPFQKPRIPPAIKSTETTSTSSRAGLKLTPPKSKFQSSNSPTDESPRHYHLPPSPLSISSVPVPVPKPTFDSNRPSATEGILATPKTQTPVITPAPQPQPSRRPKSRPLIPSMSLPELNQPSSNHEPKSNSDPLPTMLPEPGLSHHPYVSHLPATSSLSVTGSSDISSVFAVGEGKEARYIKGLSRPRQTVSPGSGAVPSPGSRDLKSLPALPPGNDGEAADGSEDKRGSIYRTRSAKGTNVLRKKSLVDKDVKNKQPKRS